MRFLADESCDFAVIRALRAIGHDVEAVSESLPGSLDDVLIERAQEAGRIFVTEDKDFGELVFAHQRRTGGVIFIRFPASARGTLADTIVSLVQKKAGELIGSFTVVKPNRVKMIRSLKS